MCIRDRPNSSQTQTGALRTKVKNTVTWQTKNADSFVSVKHWKQTKNCNNIFDGSNKLLKIRVEAFFVEVLERKAYELFLHPSACWYAIRHLFSLLKNLERIYRGQGSNRIAIYHSLESSLAFGTVLGVVKSQLRCVNECHRTGKYHDIVLSAGL